MLIKILENPYPDLNLSVGSIVDAFSLGGIWYIERNHLEIAGWDGSTPSINYYFYDNQIESIPTSGSNMTTLEDFECRATITHVRKANGSPNTVEARRQADFEKSMCDRVEKCEEVLRSAKISGESRASDLRGAIKTLSDINVQYLDELSQLEARNAELLETVKKAHEILLHEMDNGRTPNMLQGVGLGYFEDVICGVKR